MKRILKKNINIKSYWNNLLKSGKWGEERGRLHEILVKFFPKKKKITVLDIGCAIGHGTVVLVKKLLNVKFEACDFSTTGIKLAKKLYGKKIKFFVHNVYKDKLKNNYDYILLIETLEHVNNPIKIVKKYLKYCNKRMVVTVPYNERGWKEHVYSFDEHSFDKIKGFKKYYIFKKPLENTKIILYLFDKESKIK